MRSTVTLIALLVMALAVPSTLANSNLDPIVERGDSFRYRCEGGQTIKATYYSLNDRSLSFVRLQLPDGRRLTLPEVMSASGARFSSDQDVIWWIKGNSGFVQQRDEKGKWTITLSSCVAEY